MPLDLVIRVFPRLVVGALLLLCFVPSAQTAAEPDSPYRQVYSHLLDPREHPDYQRRVVKPPSWDTFKNRTQFTCLRGFNVSDGKITGYSEELEKFTRTHQLGDVIWPSYPILFASNVGDFAAEIKRRDLYLFDIWGYVPGSGPEGYWQQFKVPQTALAELETILGERWLGTDIGEQDGRYIGGYANQMTPASASRFDQYLNFQRHFERMGDDLGHKHATLVSLNFGHYFLKEGTYTMIGAETAQALPNNQVYYAFIRGAGKQYGVPWFGNASIYNRWGFKTYGPAGRDGGYAFGPTKGSSLSLLKRLIYHHILYNCVAAGFENGWFEGDKLSPIGRIQQSAQRWVKEYGQPGVMHSPVALLVDFYAGWTFPRHLYSGNIYRVWGNLPYGQGDYLTDAVLDLLYPGYEKASYFHDESGFISPTPYGDIADCLLSDAPSWLLARYPVLVVAGELQGGHEIRDKLQTYAENGGHLVITAGNLARLPGGLGGYLTTANDLNLPVGKGKITVFASAFGIDMDMAPVTQIRSQEDKPLPKPHRLRPEVRTGLEFIFRQQQLFEVPGTSLSLVTCRKGPGDYTLGIANHSWSEQPVKIVSLCGVIQSLRRLPLDDAEQGAVGQLPEGVDGKKLGHSSDTTIAGGDVSIYSVRVNESGVTEIPHVSPPKSRPGRLLPLRQANSIKAEILARPSFFEHFDGVVVDWCYVHEREKSVLRQQAAWIQRQGLHVYVDLSSGINLFPTLRLIDNLSADYASRMAVVSDLMAKMELLGARDLILSLHRHPENNFSDEQTRASFKKTLRTLATQAASRHLTLHLRMAFGKPPWNLNEAAKLLDKVDAENLRLAASTALLERDAKSEETRQILSRKLGLWLAASTRTDLSGHTWDAHSPLFQTANSALNADWLKLAPDVPVALDAVYASPDEEYRDIVLFSAGPEKPVR